MNDMPKNKNKYKIAAIALP